MAEAGDRARTERFQALLDAQPDALALLDPQGRIIEACRPVAMLLMLEPGTLSGRRFDELIDPSDRPRLLEAIREVLLHPQREAVVVLRLVGAGAAVCEVEGRLVNRLEHAGIKGLLLAMRETGSGIAQRHLELDRELSYARSVQHMAEAVASTDDPREMLNALVRAIGEGLAVDRCLICDIDRTRNLASPMCEWLNPSNPDAFSVLRDFPLSLFTSSWEFLWTERSPIVSHTEAPAASLISEGSVGIIHGELRIRSLVWFPFSFRPNGLYLLVVNQLDRRRDWREDEIGFIQSAATHAGLALQKRRILGERLAAEEQLRQSQKMEAIGRLAGGIAHDFNNLLTAIIGYADLLRAKLPPSNLTQYVDGILQVSNRAATTTHQLLSFSRRQVLTPKLVDLNTLVAQLEGMLRRLIGENIQLEVQLGDEVGCVRIDPGQLELALVNLAVNGRDAMQGGGVLTIETSFCLLERPEAERFQLPPGPYARVLVRDTGMGMDAETVARLFEPFFTTKDVGKGTGLGLSSVYGIVRASGGGVWVDSTPGAGSCFRVHLPSESAREHSPPRGQRQIPPAGGTERILLAEDDSTLRTLIGDALMARGYRVLSASNGLDALELSRTAGGIDLLLSDVVMPQMNGPELARGLVRHHPQARLLFMSGYTADAFHDSPDVAHAPVLPKPFSIDQLVRAVRAALDVEPALARQPTARPAATDPPRS